MTAELLAPDAAIGPRAATRPEQLALRIVQAGALAVVLAVSVEKSFELDRFLIPKELALHLTALFGAAFALGSLRRLPAWRVDRLLAAWLMIGLVSAALSTNAWLGFRAVAVSVSAVLLFWIARALRDAGLARRLLLAIATAVVLAAVTSLLQAYGAQAEIFSLNRAPGGTLGNRNFVGHAAAFGLAVVMLSVLRARSRGAYLAWSTGAALVIAALVLTRSRAAWLACGVVLLVTLLGLVASPALRGHGPTWRRLSGVVVLAAIAVGGALLLPNSLRWRSDNPYLESISNVADYQQGSGRGRLVQYERSLRMAVAHPLFGVGPGNWPVTYPEFARRNDPSMNEAEPGTTFNPWPSSDWVALIAERGFAATAVLLVALLLLIANALGRVVGAAEPDEALQATAMLGTIAGAAVTGAFDAVLLLGMPALLVWTTVGALSNVEFPTLPMKPMPRLFIGAALVIAMLGGARSAGQVFAMDLYSTGHRADLERAAMLDPGNYRVRLRLARIGGRNTRCEHAIAARALFPNAAAARSAARGCD